MFKAMEKEKSLLFLYGKDYEKHLKKQIYPTEKQLAYIKDLMTKLEKVMSPYGMVFPYREEVSLLKPKEKFIHISKNTEVGEVIEVINRLIAKVVTYSGTSRLRDYEQIKDDLNLLSRYFKIEKIRTIKANLGAVIPQEEVEKDIKQKEELKKKRKELKEVKKEAQAKAEWIKQYHPSVVEAPVIDIARELKKDLNEIYSANMISEKQVNALTRLINNGLAFIRLMSKDTQHFDYPYALDVIYFMTFGEAGMMVSVMGEFCEACWSVTEKEGLGFAFHFERLLSQEFIDMLKKMAEVLPYIKQTISDLEPMTEKNSVLSRQSISKMSHRLDKIKNHSNTNVIEQLNIPFNSVFEKRQFLAEFYNYLYRDYQDFDYSYAEYITVYDIVEPFFEEENGLTEDVKTSIFNDNDRVKDLLFYAEDILERIS